MLPKSIRAPTGERSRKAGSPLGIKLMLAGCVLFASCAAHAQDAGSDAVGATRPAIRSNRWQEDWSALANPALQTQPFDSLKYIPLSPSDPLSYISLGATLRERFEAIDAPSFGIGANPKDSYFLQRFQIHADIHFNEGWRFFTQIEDARAFGKKRSLRPTKIVWICGLLFSSIRTVSLKAL
jgi:hypothetical protein